MRLAKIFRSILISLWLLLGSLPLYAGEPAPFLSERDFRSLAEQLSHKVDLFREAWSHDPATEFYGGTTRDFVYWVKGQFKATKSVEESLQISRSLLSREVIEVKEFILGESDIDLVSKSDLEFKPTDYGIRSIDRHRPEIFDPNSSEGKSEILQGHIPAEKIRLNSQGFVNNPSFGNGVREIYQGRLTVHFTSPEDFAQSEYAKRFENHPIKKLPV